MGLSGALELGFELTRTIYVMIVPGVEGCKSNSYGKGPVLSQRDRTGIPTGEDVFVVTVNRVASQAELVW